MSRKKLKYYLFFALLLLIGLSIIMNLIPARFIPFTGISEFYLHLFNYSFLVFILSLLLFLNNSKEKTVYYLSFIVVFVFSIIIELSQLIIPNRGFEFKDILANLLGIVLGLIFSYFMQILIRNTNLIKNFRKEY